MLRVTCYMLQYVGNFTWSTDIMTSLLNRNRTDCCMDKSVISNCGTISQSLAISSIHGGGTVHLVWMFSGMSQFFIQINLSNTMKITILSSIFGKTADNGMTNQCH